MLKNEETVRKHSRQLSHFPKNPNYCSTQSFLISRVFSFYNKSGDIEILLELPTYMQTAICTQRCEILVLELKHFERLFVKRHQRTVEMMKDNLVLRLQSRLSPRLQQSVPLLRALLEQAIEYRTQKRLQSQV